MSRAIGAAAEKAAVAFLQANGFEVLQTNYAIRGAEIDIIAREGDCVVFVEVKHRRDADRLRPREAVTPAKQRRIILAAMRWLQAREMQSANIRFDVMESTPQGIVLLRGAFECSE